MNCLSAPPVFSNILKFGGWREFKNLEIKAITHRTTGNSCTKNLSTSLRPVSTVGYLSLVSLSGATSIKHIQRNNFHSWYRTTNRKNRQHFYWYSSARPLCVACIL